uniref:Uncharacterized protein n=1 Tax=Cacopsylla melanoneura TaxID=428564 RepID=A0A8D8ZFC1_9HEMI
MMIGYGAKVCSLILSIPGSDFTKILSGVGLVHLGNPNQNQVHVFKTLSGNVKNKVCCIFTGLIINDEDLFMRDFLSSYRAAFDEKRCRFIAFDIFQRYFRMMKQEMLNQFGHWNRFETGFQRAHDWLGLDTTRTRFVRIQRTD